MCDDNGERRGEAQWFQLASPRGATTTTTISAEHRHRQHQHCGDSVFVYVSTCSYVYGASRGRGERERKRESVCIGAIGRVATNREGPNRTEKRRNEQQRVGERERDEKKEHGGRSTHRERRLSRRGPRTRKATTIIFHRQKRKGRTPFISPGSVGSHVVGAAGCDTSITDRRPACTVTSCVVRSYVRLHDTVHVDRWHRTSYITDISAPRPLCSSTDISVIAGLNARRAPRRALSRELYRVLRALPSSSFRRFSPLLSASYHPPCFILPPLMPRVPVDRSCSSLPPPPSSEPIFLTKNISGNDGFHRSFYRDPPIYGHHSLLLPFRGHSRIHTEKFDRNSPKRYLPNER